MQRDRRVAADACLGSVPAALLNEEYSDSIIGPHQIIVFGSDFLISEGHIVQRTGIRRVVETYSESSSSEATSRGKAAQNDVNTPETAFWMQAWSVVSIKAPD